MDARVAGHHKLSSRNVPALKLQAHIDAQLSQVQLEELEGRLTDKRRELTERVEHLEQQMVIKDDCSHADAADAASRALPDFQRMRHCLLIPREPNKRALNPRHLLCVARCRLPDPI